MCENNIVTGILELLKNALNCKEDIEDGRMDIRSTKYSYFNNVYTFHIDRSQKSHSIRIIFSRGKMCSAMKNIIS